MKFNVTILAYEQIEVRFPVSVNIDKASMTFSQSTGVMTFDRDPKGNKVSVYKYKEHHCKRTRFSRAKWCPDFPRGMHRGEVTFENGSFSLRICEPVKRTAPAVPKPVVPTTVVDVQNAITLIEQYAKNNGYDVTLVGGRIVLEKVDIIEGVDE